MDAQQIRGVLLDYRKEFEENDIPKRKAPHGILAVNNLSRLAHCHAMLDDMEVFLQEGDIGKAERWLCFIQGCLWSAGWSTIEELKNQNRQ